MARALGQAPPVAPVAPVQVLARDKAPAPAQEQDEDDESEEHEMTREEWEAAQAVMVRKGEARLEALMSHTAPLGSAANPEGLPDPDED